MGGATTSAAGLTPDNPPYDTKSFSMPFDVTMPGWLPAEPSIEQPNFVTWQADDGNRAVRVLIPVTVYPPGAAATTPPPKDYPSYLLGQADHGAHFTDQTKVTVDGRPATILTATVDRSLDGSIGCPEVTMAAGERAGLQPDLNLRMAVIDAGDRTLLIWLRNSVGVDQPMELDSFAQMLASIRFSDRAVQAPLQQGATTPIDGVWTATWTYDDLKNSPLLVQIDLNDENWGDVTMTFDHGLGTFAQTNPKKTSSYSGTFRVEGDVLYWILQQEQFIMRWSITGDQLTLSRDESLGAGSLSIAPTPLVLRPFTRRP
jgi:hypothetical protein